MLKIYDEVLQTEISSPDLTAGYLYDGVIVTGYTEPLVEVIPGTITENRPEGLRRTVPARPITEACQWYHAYTEEELAQKNEKTVDEKISDAVTAAVALAQGGMV